MREMKNSGVEWIGEIPADWRVIKNKYLLKFMYSGGTPSSTNSEFYCDNGIPFVSISDMSNTAFVNKTKKHITYEGLLDKNLKVLKKGTILYSIYATIGAVSELKVDAAISQAMLALSTNEDVERRYYKYNLEAMKDYVYFNANGNTQFNLNAEKVNNFFFVLPSLTEQHRIADFLDEKYAKIDAVIEKQKQVIEKLKEYKLSVITEAVTKGLDPAVPMKDSGVEWIGEIPEKWSVTKASRIIVNTQNGLTRRDLDISAGNIVLKLKNIYADGRINYSDTNRIALTDKEIASYRLQDGDFLFVRVNGSKHLVGKCAIYKEISEVVAYNDHIIRVRLNNLCNKRFFQLYLMSVPGKREIDLHTSTAAGQFTISGEGLRDIIVLLPDISEQKIIVEYLDKIICKIDSAIAKKQSIIEKLTEYKKSLIYEVVTGKKEV